MRNTMKHSDSTLTLRVTKLGSSDDAEAWGFTGSPRLTPSSKSVGNEEYDISQLVNWESNSYFRKERIFKVEKESTKDSEMSTICIALLLLAAKHCAAVDVEALTRGVNPEGPFWTLPFFHWDEVYWCHQTEFERYSPEKSPLFTCRDDSKQIPWDMVNDGNNVSWVFKRLNPWTDFCDCKDGSDESGKCAWATSLNIFFSSKVLEFVWWAFYPGMGQMLTG